MELVKYDFKALRSRAVARYMERCGHRRAVCLSCGNASRKLREAGVEVLDVSPTGDLAPLRWFTMEDVRMAFPGHFDATSGHLPMDCMLEVAEEFRASCGWLPAELRLPTGSGETLVCLKMAFPDRRVVAVYNLGPETEYSPDAPLNALVRALADGVEGL